MNRSRVLSYCKLCLNKKNDIQKGVICSLTNDLGTFQNTCSSYKLDEKEFQKKNDYLNSLIEEELSSFIGFRRNQDKIKVKNLKVYEDKTIFIFSIILAVFISLIILYDMVTKAESARGYIVPWLFVAVITFTSIFQLLKASKMPIVEINQDFVILEGRKIPLDDIFLLGRGSDINNNQQNYIVLATISGNSLTKIDVLKLGFGRKYFFNLINSYLKLQPL